MHNPLLKKQPSSPRKRMHVHREPEASAGQLLAAWDLQKRLTLALEIIACQAPKVAEVNTAGILCNVPVYKSRSLAYAGRAFLSPKWENVAIEMHPAFFLREAETDRLLREERNDTLCHELAHVLAFALFRERAHGVAWRFCFSAFGFMPERVLKCRYTQMQLVSYEANRAEIEKREALSLLAEVGFTGTIDSNDGE